MCAGKVGSMVRSWIVALCTYCYHLLCTFAQHEGGGSRMVSVI